MFKTVESFVKNTGKCQLGDYQRGLTPFLLLFVLIIASMNAQTIQMVRYFDTWQGTPQIKSTDPAGIGYHAPSGRLYIADSEIDEIPAVFTGPNVFEISSSGDSTFQEITTSNNNDEPTGITYNEYDGYFYLSNDDAKTITRYDTDFTVLAQIITTYDEPSATDPEGITSDPLTGYIYVVDGSEGGRQVLIYNSSLLYQGAFSLVAPVPGIDPEGIAFNPDNNNLFVVWGQARKIYQFTTTGTLLDSCDIGGFSPQPLKAQGLTFAPTSDPNDDPGDLALYIADAMVDNDIDPNERDGRIYEAIVSIADFIATPQLIAAGSEVSFTNLSPDYITNYSWDFGDGEISTERDPSHIYDAGGAYTVSLTVSGPTGTDTETKTDYITVADTSVSFQDGINGYNGTRDTWLNLDILNQNNGNEIQLQADGKGPNKSALVYWDLSSIPFGSTVYAVDVTVNITDPSGSATYEIYDLKRVWIEDEATWQVYASGQTWEAAGADGAGDRGSTPFGAIVSASYGADTTSLNAAGVAMVQSWVDDPSSNHGFIVQDYINHTNGLKFSSREATTVIERPKLTVVYSPPPRVLVEARIFLEGAYNAAGDSMRTDLRDNEYIPMVSPYTQNPRPASPPIPLNITDWVLVELRETADGSAIASKSAFLRNDGRIVADDGTTEQITMNNVSEGYYYIVVRHRNHLAVMSAGSVQLNGDFSTLYDFTTGTGRYHGSDAKLLETNIYGMYKGDANGNSFVNSADYLKVKSEIGSNGNYNGDCNLNSFVNSADYLNVKPNVGKSSQVP